MRSAETILNEMLEKGKTLEHIRCLATAIDHKELRAMVDEKMAEQKRQVA